MLAATLVLPHQSSTRPEAGVQSSARSLSVHRAAQIAAAGRAEVLPPSIRVSAEATSAVALPASVLHTGPGSGAAGGLAPFAPMRMFAGASPPCTA